VADRICPKPGCAETIPRGMFACRAHWFELPPNIRREIVDAYAGYRRDPLVYASELVEWQEAAQAFWQVGY
jgi:hypothetical protein